MSRFISRCLVAFAPALLVLIASSAMAQPGGGRGQGGFGQGGFGGFGGGMGGGSVLFTVMNDQVQKELELSDEQKESLTKLSQDSRGQRPDFQALQNLSQEERDKKIAEFRDQYQARAQETNKKVNEILLPSQQDRLKQIIVQTQGPQAALNNDDLAKALGLSEDQKQKIKDIAGESMQKLIEEKVLSVLTADQQSKLEQMKGKKFEYDRNAGGQQRGNRGTGGTRGNGNNPQPNNQTRSL